MSENLINDTVTCIERYASSLKNITEDKAQVNEVYSKLQEQIDFYSNTLARTKATNVLLEESLEKISCAEDAEEAKQINQKFEESLKNIKKIDDANNPWRNIIGKLLDEEDIQMVKSSQNVIDPISKKRLVDPVKNTQCGHSYEKQMVLALIAKNPRTRCPIIGCPAAQYISKNHLVPDHELKRFLESNADESVQDDDTIVSLDETC